MHQSNCIYFINTWYTSKIFLYSNCWSRQLMKMLFTFLMIIGSIEGNKLHNLFIKISKNFPGICIHIIIYMCAIIVKFSLNHSKANLINKKYKRMQTDFNRFKSDS